MATTWTCEKCQNVNPVSECTCLRPNCSGTPFKPVDRPAGLSEEERAVLEAFNAGRIAKGCEEYSENSWVLANCTRLEATAFYRAARAPLEAENKALRERHARELGAMHLSADKLQEANDDLEADNELAHKRVEELKEQLAQAQKPAPAGLPEVNSDVEIMFEGAFVRDVVRHHRPDTTWGPCFAVRNHPGLYALDLEGEEWRRLPPAQMSRGPAQPKGVRAAIDEAIKRFGGQGDGMFNLANFSAALKMQTGTRDAYDGNLCRVILADRDDVEMCSPGDAHYRLKKPAASSPGEVTTENFDKVNVWELRAHREIAREACVADIRANVERETAKDKARIAELEAKLRESRILAEKDRGDVAMQRDAALADVEARRRTMCDVLGMQAEATWTGVVTEARKLRDEAERLRGELALADRPTAANILSELRRMKAKAHADCDTNKQDVLIEVIALVKGMEKVCAPAQPERKVPKKGEG